MELIEDEEKAPRVEVVREFSSTFCTKEIILGLLLHGRADSYILAHLKLSEGKCSEAISNRNDIHDGNPLPPNRKTSNPAGLKTQIGPLLFFSPSLCCTTLNLLSTTGPMITPEQKRNCYEEQFALYIPFTQNKRSDLI